MKAFILKASVILFAFFVFFVEIEAQTKTWAIAIHGGAGNISREFINAEQEKEYLTVLQLALKTGADILKNGGKAEEAIEKTIRIMEDSPLFNAGKGAVFTNAGTIELDAAYMDGATLKAGAIAGVTDVKNPISAAIAVMNKSVHVMLSGKGASEFAKLQGLEIVDNSYFHTEARWNSLQKALKNEKDKKELDKKGTVGCVVLDQYGNLAAGTSTGGMTNKKYGRIGDAPIIGAGTYANNATCAVSATGHGEFFIRYTVAHDISALMEYKDLSLKDAANLVVMEKLVKAGGEGGIISVSKKGEIAMPFNSNGMFRGAANS
ncbi:MAG TPA: beta-aspartyl-peptidase, partial [Bacteroidales bacterium]|nr:beta-aspartyl-peptidase [Bacteroidales bacterium]